MKQSQIRAAGLLLVALLGGVLVFQLLMAFGLSLPGAAWGGQLDANPAAQRVASILASLILLFAILLVLEKLGFVRLLRRRRLINGLLWFFAAYFLLNTAANLFSPGGIERFVMTPLALASCVLCAILASAAWAG